MNVQSDPRLAGDVKRYHCWPVLQPQTVAEHAWNVARIVLTVYPGASPALIAEALLHDSGEIAAGDPPFPVKANNPALKAEHDRLESAARSAMFAHWRQPMPARLTPYEYKVLKIADILEMMEKGMQEQLLGNRFAAPIVQKTADWLRTNVEALPASTFRSNVVDYVDARCEEWGSIGRPIRKAPDGQEAPFGYCAEEEVG